MSLTRFLTLVLLLTATVASAESKVRVSGIYSNLRYIDEAGDLLGYEIMIVPAQGRFFAIVQIAEGEPGPPEIVEVKVAGPAVSFLMQDGSRFTGRVTKHALNGEFHFESGGKEQVSLRRGRSYWQ